VLNRIRVQELEISLDELVHLLQQNNYNGAGDTHIILIQASTETTFGLTKLTDRWALSASADRMIGDKSPSPPSETLSRNPLNAS